MPLSDRQIREKCSGINGVLPPRGALISPFEPEQVRKVEVPKLGGVKAISFGTSSYGYDFRLSAANFKVFRNPGQIIIDPKNFDQRLLEATNVMQDASGSYFVIPGNCYALGETEEWVNMPDDVTAIGVGKSTYARCGVLMNVTPLEAGWSGKITLGIANASPAPAKLYAGEGICQFVFLRGEERCLVSYSDRSGKYQNQQGLTTARVSGV
jgi:dCTP deaminase